MYESLHSIMRDSSLSIVIVVYYNEVDLVNCIRSLYEFLPTDLFDLIVVSNGFDITEKSQLLITFPLVYWIDMGYNAGFARANNEGIKVATGEAVLLLNPDTIATDQSVKNCFKRLINSNYAAAGVQLVDETMRPQISGSYFVKGGLNHLLPIPYWGKFIRWIGYRTKTSIPNVQEAKPTQEVDWISGAFLMVKRSAIDKAGLMDDDFFLYGEEVEWCSRLGTIGKLVLFGDLKIIHLEGTTINKSQELQEKGYYNLYDKKGLQLMVSNHLRVRKQYGVTWFLVLLLNYTFGCFIFILFSGLRRFFGDKKFPGEMEKAFAFCKNVIRLWKLAPTIIRNKPHFYKMF